ncbi:hypothetical protein FB567DRAFT_514887 [Paraphoma chrysanthemicola]|uniref:SnoaL-like domain-containing protein n=1 Tax=Paraphoma chrysanthemicola TaxID=798071 RepID=A0A8K0RE37_9PLEO|nr:hypothetical protein FB567DRAFT_514887 [Paraphoma chrysanthemicola]
MRPFSPKLCTRSLQSLTKPTITASLRQTRFAKMSTSSDLNIENKNVQTAPGISLSSQQQTVVGSILDLFAGRPSLAKLALWRDDATFSDPLTIATGRDKYAAQWYGLQQAFSEIERLDHKVTDAGNPILMDLKTRYVIKGIGKEQTIQSIVAIHLDGEGKIQKVEDKWNGKLPEGSISEAFRHLNAVTVPKIVSVPKNAEEDAKKGN